MTDLQVFAAVWPFIVLGLFITFAQVLVRRDLAAFKQAQAAIRDHQVKEAAE